MANNVVKTSFGNIDLSTAPIYASQFGDGTSYGLDMTVNGQEYKYIPASLVQNGGVTAGDNTYLMPWFANQDNLKTFSKNASPVDMSQVDFADYLNKSGLGTTGYLVKADAVPFDSQVTTQPTSTLGGSLNGLKNADGQIVYGITGGGGNRYLTTSGEVHNPTIKYTSLLGDWFGDVGQSVADAWNGLGPIGQAALAYYGAGAISDALGGSAAGAAGGETAGLDIGSLPTAGPGVQIASTDAAAGLNEAAAAAEAANAAQGLQIPQAANLAEMGGGQGLAGGTTLANLADMGGAQGLTAAGAGLAAGEALSAGGVGGAITPAAAGIGTGLGLSDAATSAGSALAGSTAANALTGAAAGSTLADILPYTTAAGLASGYLQSNAAKEAAQIQADAAAKALAQQQKNFETINAQQAPYRAAGYGALNKIAQLGGGSTAQYDANGNRIADLANVGTAAQGAGDLTSMLGQASGGAPIAPTGWTRGSDYGSPNINGTPYTDASGQVVGYLGANGFVDKAGNPVQAGTATQAFGQPAQQTFGQPTSDYLTHQFNAADLAAGLAPNYNFMLQQGQMANQRAANAGGGGLSGNALQGLQKYTQDYAGNAYQNAFNNYQTQRSNIYNTLASIAGIGQTGQNATNTAATNATNAATQLGVGAAGAQAAGTTGSANAYTNAINNATQNYTLASLLNQRGNVTMPTGG